MKREFKLRLFALTDRRRSNSSRKDMSNVKDGCSQVQAPSAFGRALCVTGRCSVVRQHSENIHRVQMWTLKILENDLSEANHIRTKFDRYFGGRSRRKLDRLRRKKSRPSSSNGVQVAKVVPVPPKCGSNSARVGLLSSTFRLLSAKFGLLRTRARFRCVTVAAFKHPGLYTQTSKDATTRPPSEACALTDVARKCFRHRGGRSPRGC